MKNIFFILLLVFLIYELNGQISFEVSKLELENIDTITYHGPVFNFHCRLINSSSDTVFLFPLADSILLTFNLDHVTYKKRCLSYNLDGGMSNPLHPGDTTIFTFKNYLLFATSYTNTYRTDFYEPLLRLLPTLRLIYKPAYLPIIECHKIIDVVIKK